MGSQAIEGERSSVLAHGQLTRADEDNQHMQTVDDDIPEGLPDPPPPPNKPMNPSNKSPSVKLERERKLAVSSNNAHTSDEVDVLGVSGSIEDARKWPKKLHDTSVHVREQLEQGGQENSPMQVPEAPDKPDSEMAVPGNVRGTRNILQESGMSILLKWIHYVKILGQEDT